MPTDHERRANAPTAPPEAATSDGGDDSRFHRMLAALPLGAHRYLLAGDGRVLFVGANAAAGQLTGASPAALVGRPLEEAFPALAGTPLPRQLADVAETGLPGQAGPVSYDGDPGGAALDVYAFQVAPREVVALFLDVRPDREAEAERRRLQDQVSRMQRLESIGRLAGGIAHDFNNLLTAIMGSAEFARDELAPGDPAVAELNEILKAGQRAAELTQQLLAFGRKQIISPQVLDLGNRVRLVLRLLQRLLGEDVSVVLEAAPRLARVHIDPGQLDQVIINLAVNARDAMPSGGELRLRVQMASIDPAAAAQHPEASPGLFVALAVEDTGVGMDEATLAHIFDPFFTTKPEGKGTGLGLSTVYGVVRQAGGFVDVVSAVGAGTTFTIYLPAMPEEKAWSTPVPRSVFPRGCETVLLVEDEESVRRVAQRILAARGYHVLSAANAGEAARLFAEHEDEIDLLLTDVVMPGMNGRELYEQLAAVRPGLKVLFASGYATDSIADQGVLALDTPFLQKPYTISGLAAMVRDVLDS